MMATTTVSKPRATITCHCCTSTEVGGRGLCAACYNRHYRAGTLEDYPLSERDVVEISGITYRQLDHWCRQGYLKPIHGGGTGVPRQWPEDELNVVQQMARLVSAGLPPGLAVEVARGKTEIAPGIRVVVES